MNLRTKLLIAALAIAALMTGPEAVSAAGCGPTPPPPPPPPGCKKMVPTCQCNAQGRECHYVFVCEK